MIYLLILLTITSLIYLLGGRPAPIIAREEEARRLIAQYQEHSDADKDPQGKSERDYRLYQELAALLGKDNGGAQGKLSGIIYLLVPACFCLAIMAWQLRGGAEMQRWQGLYRSIGAEIAQHTIYGKNLLDQAAFRQNINQRVNSSGFFPAGSRHTPLLVYCQALQRQLDRSDIIQLDALGHCYSELGLFELAAPVYDRIDHLQPDAEQPPAPEVMQKLHKLLVVEPDNSLALLFLASAYQQHQQMDKALSLWQQLLTLLPQDDPLYPAIRQAADKARQQLDSGSVSQEQNISGDNPHTQNQANTAANKSYAVSISIAPEILAQLPATARLFLIIAPAGQKMPLAVKMLPPQAAQDINISDADSMAGASLSEYPQLVIRALLSPSGTVGDNAVASNCISSHDLTHQCRKHQHLTRPASHHPPSLVGYSGRASHSSDWRKRQRQNHSAASPRGTVTN